MTIKSLSAIVVVSAALSSPVLARTAHVRGPAYDGPAYHLRHYRGAYDQAPLAGPLYVPAPAPRGWIGEDLQFDRSFPGGKDPDLRPAI